MAEVPDDPDEEASDAELVDRAAHDFLRGYGDRALEVLRDMEEMAREAGDTLSGNVCADIRKRVEELVSGSD